MMKKPIRLSRLSLVLLLGHLAIIAGLAFSALTEKKTPPAARPEESILNCLRD